MGVQGEQLGCLLGLTSHRECLGGEQGQRGPHGWGDLGM